MLLVDRGGTGVSPVRRPRTPSAALGPGLILALRTVMAAAADNDHSLDGSLAHKARVAFAPIYAMLELKKTFLPVGIDIVRNR